MLGKRLSNLLKHGKLSIIGKPLFNCLVGIELRYVCYRDSKISFGSTLLVDAQLTAIIKTFERPEALKRLVTSIKYFYPNMHIIVVDDSEKTTQLEEVVTLTMAYDSGVSAGRQMALDNVATPYVLLLDDDFIFYHHTDLEPVMLIMEENPLIDIMGGEVVNLPSFKSMDYRHAKLHPTQLASVMEEGSTLAGFPVFDKVPNFYIARTERLKLVGWDKRIKRLDHAEFFTRAKGVLITVFNRRFKILHAQTPFDKHYMKIRNDVASDRGVLFNKFYQKTKG